MVKPLFVSSRDGTRIAYEAAGHGQAVVIILGALNSRKSGTRLAKLLASRFKVVNYDRRGRGDSGDTAPYSPEREVEDVAALVSALGEPACLYGHSSGAAVALRAAVALGMQVAKVAIYEAPYAVDAASRDSASEYYRTLVPLLRSGRSGDAVALFVRSVGVSDKQVEAMRALPMWPGLERLAPTLAYDSEVLGEGHALPADLLRRVTTPTLVMHGGSGAASMRAAARAISEAIPGAQLRTLERQTHGVSLLKSGPIRQRHAPPPGWPSPSASGRRSARIHASCAVVVAPTLDWLARGDA